METDRDRRTLIYAEHIVRYQFAAELVRGKSVLDVASGSGYGSGIMAAAGASRVVGVDRHPAAVHASENRYSPSASFLLADGERLPIKDHSFECVVSFETIEHVRHPELFLSELKRVLSPGGTLIISSPNGMTYPEGNPFHIREFTYEEFEALLKGCFANVQMLAQENWIASTILPDGLFADFDEDAARPSKLITCTERNPAESLYAVGLCSDAHLPPAPLYSALSRVSETATWLDEMHKRDREIDALRLAVEQNRLRHDLEEASLREVVELNEQKLKLTPLADAVQPVSTGEQYRQRIDELEAILISKQAMFDTRLKQVSAERDRAAGDLRAIHGSQGWRILSLYRKALSRIPLVHVTYPAIRRMLSRTLGVSTSQAEINSGVDQQAVPQLPPALVFPSFSEPMASIVVPVHNNRAFTHQCLASILSQTHGVPYEVILVDDASTDDTAQYCSARLENVKVLVNASIQGYLRSTNRGAAAARAPFLVFLNNDTQVRPGWLKALIQPALSNEKVALAGAKLLYPDLTLQEAGGIVWSDGTGCNYGRNDDPGKCEYNYLREVDYCSGACLLVRRDFFEDYGGLDERFAPAYYEDADLAFAARQRGFRVIYQPQAEVVHHEGISSGTDPSSGTKRFQEVNRAKFVDKWKAELGGQHQAGSNLLRARDRSQRDRILIVDAAVPPYDEDAGSLRMDTLMACLIELGLSITFVPDNRDPRQPYTSRLQQAGIEVLYGAYDLSQRVAAMTPRLRMCLASRPSVAWRYLATLREFAPDCAFVFDTVDLHYLREFRRAEYEGKEWLKKLSAGYRELELALVRASDRSVTVTETERRALAEQVPGARLHNIPTVHRIATSVPSFEDRKDLLFVGGFNHPPNGAGVDFFVRQIFPLIREELPEVTLYVVGSNPPDYISALHSSAIRVIGHVPDLSPFLQGCRVSVVPLTFGAGLKGKMTQSLSEGLPVVSTSVGVEGTELIHGKDVLIADEPAEFAKVLVNLYLDRDEWDTLSRNGLEYAERNYSVRAVRRMLEELLIETGIRTH